MSERLEEIGETIDKIFEMRDNDDIYQFDEMESFWTYDVPYLYKQAEQVDGLIKLIAYHQQKQKEAEDKNEPYRHQNKCYRKALEFYADLKNWRKTHTERVNNSPSKVIADTGDKARQALEELE